MALARARSSILRAAASLRRLNSKGLTSKMEHERYATIVENSADVLISLDEELRVSYASPALEKTWGRLPELIVGRPFVDIVEEAHAQDLATQLAQALAQPRSGPLVCSTMIRRSDGVVRDCEAVVASVAGAQGVGGLVATLRDVTERRSLDRELQRGALRDDLTGLVHSALFYDRLVHALAARAQRRDTHVALLLVDLDDFKQVNEQLGQAAGDRLLVGVGERLQRCARAADTVARLGGDRFALLLEGNATRPEAIRLAQRMLQVLSLPLEAGELELSVRASAGIALAEEATSAENLVANTELAMREAKGSETGGYEIFDPGMRS